MTVHTYNNIREAIGSGETIARLANGGKSWAYIAALYGLNLDVIRPKNDYLDDIYEVVLIGIVPDGRDVVVKRATETALWKCSIEGTEYQRLARMRIAHTKSEDRYGSHTTGKNSSQSTDTMPPQFRNRMQAHTIAIKAKSLADQGSSISKIRATLDIDISLFQPGALFAGQTETVMFLGTVDDDTRTEVLLIRREDGDRWDVRYHS